MKASVCNRYFELQTQSPNSQHADTIHNKIVCIQSNNTIPVLPIQASPPQQNPKQLLVNQMIYPIRVDASSSDNKIRIIDTILIDPTCLPVTPTPHTTQIGTDAATGNELYAYPNLHHENIILNAQFLAETLLSDMEVEGFSKTSKIGRVALLSNKGLLKDVELQIQGQLRALLDKEQSSRRKKRKLNHGEDEEKSVEEKKEVEEGKALPKSDGDEDKPADMSSTLQIKEESKEESKDEPMEEPKEEPMEEPMEDTKDSTKTQVKEDSSEESEPSNTTTASPNTDHLLPIKIRIREHGICIADEFKIDPDHPASNPIILAEALVADMNLPLHLTNSIAISIAEQMCGLDIGKDITGWTMMEQVVADNNPTLPTVSKRVPVNSLVPSAWKTEKKEENLMKAHYLKVGKPNYELNSGN